MRGGYVFALLLGMGDAGAATPPYFDPHFGDGGGARIAFDLSVAKGNPSGDNNDTAMVGVAMPDGRLLIGGEAENGTRFQSTNGALYTPSDLVIARLLPNGQPDLSFGTSSGRVALGLGGTASKPVGNLTDLLVDGNQKIVYAGYYGDPAQAPTLVYGRLNGNGQPDTSFNLSSRHLFSPAAFQAGANVAGPLKVRLQSDGKLIGTLAAATINATTSTACMGVLRLTVAGDLDLTFGQGSGIACYAPPLPAPFAVGLDSRVLADGKILLAGAAYHLGGSSTDMAITRLRADGSQDTTFGTPGTGGWAFAAFDLGGALTDLATTMTVDASGRIWLTGYASSDDGLKTGVVRLMPNGEPDTSFGISGRMVIDNLNPQDAAILGDGRLLVSGYADVPGANTSIPVVVAVDTQGRVDSHFGDAGIFSLAAWSQAPWIVPQGDHVLFVGQRQYGTANAWNADIFVARYLWNALFATSFETLGGAN